VPDVLHDSLRRTGPPTVLIRQRHNDDEPVEQHSALAIVGG
jgi:hypothetical protein